MTTITKSHLDTLRQVANLLDGVSPDNFAAGWLFGQFIQKILADPDLRQAFVIVLHAGGVKPGEYDKTAITTPDGSQRSQWVRKLPPINLEPRSQSEIEQLERLERMQALEREQAAAGAQRRRELEQAYSMLALERERVRVLELERDLELDRCSSPRGRRTPAVRTASAEQREREQLELSKRASELDLELARIRVALLELGRMEVESET